MHIVLCICVFYMCVYGYIYMYVCVPATRPEFEMRKHQAIFYKMPHLQSQKQRII